MSEARHGPAPLSERGAWLRDLRRVNERQEDAIALEPDGLWEGIEDTHRAWVERFLARLPADGRILDAACGTGKYFSMVLTSGRSVVGVDQSGGYLAKAGQTFPAVPTAKYDLQDIPFDGEFDGVMCVDAMEFVPPEEWPEVLARFRRALRPGGWLYLTVELAPGERVRALNREARDWGLPLVEGEVIWDGRDGYYHHYPAMERVREWLADGSFAIEEEAEGPWDQEEDYAYHHVLARLAGPDAEGPS